MEGSLTQSVVPNAKQIQMLDPKAGPPAKSFGS